MRRELGLIHSQDTSADVIMALEAALETARSGVLSSVGILYVKKDGSTGQRHSALPSVGLMIASAACFQHDLMSMICDD